MAKLSKKPAPKDKKKAATKDKKKPAPKAKKKPDPKGAVEALQGVRKFLGEFTFSIGVALFNRIEVLRC